MASDVTALLQRADDLLQAADERGVPLRLLGSLAFRVHCPTYGERLTALRREEPGDLDLAAPGNAYRQVRATFEDRGYAMDEQVAVASDRAQLYFQDRDGVGVDVYLGRLNYCHPIALDGRLDRDRPTVPLAELLLTKLQIVELTDKDVKDSAVLLLEHDLAEGQDAEVIDAARIADVLAQDWGFYYTATTNLDKVRSRVDAFSELGESGQETVRDRLQRLRDAVEEAPKSRRWKMRAKVGPRVQWYQQVEDKHHQPVQGREA
jgi:hypothetical protein